MILELFDYILNKSLMNKNNIKSLEGGYNTQNTIPGTSSVSSGANAMNLTPMPMGGPTTIQRAQTLPSNISTSTNSPGGQSNQVQVNSDMEVDSNPDNDGMGDEMAGLCMLLLVVIFGLTIAIWLYTEKRVLKKDMKSKKVKSETKPEVVAIKK